MMLGTTNIKKKPQCCHTQMACRVVMYVIVTLDKTVYIWRLKIAVIRVSCVHIPHTGNGLGEGIGGGGVLWG